MPACTQCGGFKTILGKHPVTGQTTRLACPCTTTETPGRIPHTQQINYPPEVIQALQQAGQLQRDALHMRDNPPG